MRSTGFFFYAAQILLFLFPLVILAQEDGGKTAEVWEQDWDEHKMMEEIDFEVKDWHDFDGIRFFYQNFNFHTGGRFVLDAIKYSYANDRRSGIELNDARLFIGNSFKQRLKGVDFAFWIVAGCLLLLGTIRRR